MPVTDPFRFFETYTIELSDDEAPRLSDARPRARPRRTSTVRHDGELGRLALNLRAPIVIVGGRGYQVINQAPGASLRAPLIAAR